MTCNCWLYLPPSSVMCLKWRVAIMKLSSLTQSNALSPRWQHIYCSHGHHIYHPVHGIQWLANQRGITHDDVRWAAQLCLSQTTAKKKMQWQQLLYTIKSQHQVKKDADWQRNQCVSVAWLLGAWREVNDKRVPLAWWYDIPSEVITVTVAALHLYYWAQALQLFGVLYFK